MNYKAGIMLFALILSFGMVSAAEEFKPIWNPYGNTFQLLHKSFGNVTVDNLTVDNIFAGNTTGGDVNLYNNFLIHGNLTVMEYITAVNLTEVNANGSIIPVFDDMFNVGNTSNRFAEGHFVDLYAENLETNLDGTGYNITADNFLGDINSSYVQNPIWVEAAGDSMTGNLNMTDNIIYNVSEIHFDNGFIIRGAP